MVFLAKVIPGDLLTMKELKTNKIMNLGIYNNKQLTITFSNIYFSILFFFYIVGIFSDGAFGLGHFFLVLAVSSFGRLVQQREGRAWLTPLSSGQYGYLYLNWYFFLQIIKEYNLTRSAIKICFVYHYIIDMV
ncbi:hypothetical protein ACJX0J_026157 [Zea mays]